MTSEADLDLWLSLVKLEGLILFSWNTLWQMNTLWNRSYVRKERVEKGMESAIWTSQSLANSYCFSWLLTNCHIFEMCWFCRNSVSYIAASVSESWNICHCEVTCTLLTSIVLLCSVLHFFALARNYCKVDFPASWQEVSSKKGEDLEATVRLGCPCATAIVKIQCKWEQSKTFSFALQ